MQDAGGASSSGGGGGGSFETLHEFHAPSLVASLRLCPTMDLLLLLTVKGSVYIYRIASGQRIAHLETQDDLDHRITSVCWKHDGKQIALAYSDGRISIHDVARVVSKVSDTSKPELPIAGAHGSEVTCLCWTPALSASPGKRGGAEHEPIRLEDRARSIFHSLPALSSAYTIRDGMRKEEYEWRPNYRGLDYLVSADKAGNIHIQAFGLLTLLKIDIEAKVRMLGFFASTFDTSLTTRTFPRRASRK